MLFEEPQFSSWRVVCAFGSQMTCVVIWMRLSYTVQTALEKSKCFWFERKSEAPRDCTEGRLNDRLIHDWSDHIPGPWFLLLCLSFPVVRAQEMIHVFSSEKMATCRSFHSHIRIGHIIHHHHTTDEKELISQTTNQPTIIRSHRGETSLSTVFHNKKEHAYQTRSSLFPSHIHASFQTGSNASSSPMSLSLHDRAKTK